MKRILIILCIISIFTLLNTAKSSDEEQVRNSLIEFMSKLSNGNGVSDPTSGWNSLSYPCTDKWRGITCDRDQPVVNEILLEGLNLSGILDPRIVCSTQFISESLLVIDITNNFIQGTNLEDIANCTQLTHLLLSGNQFSGNLPMSISQLKNLKILDLSHNKFSGSIPSFDFSSLTEFDVSYNNLSGAIPNGAYRFKTDVFIQNPELCGPPLPNNCTSDVMKKDSTPAAQPKHEKGGDSNGQILMFAGYVLIGLAVLAGIALCLYKKCKTTDKNADSDKKVVTIDDSNDSITKSSFSTIEMKTGELTKTDISAISAENSMVSSSLIVLNSPEISGLVRFEDLLKAPAELLGRGKHGSVYKVAAQRMILVVKRIKDWTISNNEFKQRMRRLDLVKHSNVMPAIAFYSSRMEKLLVYEYQQNGSLLRLIHSNGNPNRQPFDWSSRLSVAATIAEALAFMHEELQYDKIPHGNLKSSNILLNNNMEPCISEYGLMIEDIQEQQQSHTKNPQNTPNEDQNSLFKADIYAFGVILLELLTGRMVLNNGLDLASWVVAVVREEWTVEVFDKNLILEGASEENLVRVLQVAIKCVNKLPSARPDMSHVALMVNEIKEDDERSMDVSGLTSTMTRSFIDM